MINPAILDNFFTPSNWFWVIGGDESRFWSSADGRYVDVLPPNFNMSIQSALDAQVGIGGDQYVVFRIASEAELNDVLRPYGLALPAPTVDDYKTAIQNHIDAVARAKDYENGFALAGYATDPYAAHADAAQAFINWRSAVWVSTFQTLAEVQSGELPQPTIPELIAMLPASPWPVTPQVKD